MASLPISILIIKNNNNLTNKPLRTMKKSLLYLSAFLLALSTFVNCSVKDAVDDLSDTQKALDCAYLIEDIDEKWDREDRDCDDIKSDVAKILDTCKDFISEEQKSQLEFYAANCDTAN